MTPWEIAIKQAAGRLDFPLDLFEGIVATSGFDVLPVFPAHGIKAARLPRHHDDPFDRMLIGQALVEDLVLVTRDRIMARYEVPIIGPVAG